jgi:hypothetical protein
MSTRSLRRAVFLATVLGASSVRGQEAGSPSLFASDEVLELTLAADFSLLKSDREEETPERPGTLTLQAADGRQLVLDVQLRTRGSFRKERANCSFPPLRLNLEEEQVVGTVFEGQDKLKMVGSCRPHRPSYEQLVLQEYLAYRTFALVSDVAFRVRLARITYVDQSGEEEPSGRFAFFIEDDDALAARLGARVIELPEGRKLPPRYIDPTTEARMALFQYMMGNTDWLDDVGHNVELLDLGGRALTVPYDFDFSGIVNAPYAIPHPRLGLRSVLERRFLGRCWPGMDMDPVVETFRGLRVEILGLYETFPYLEEEERDRAIRYLAAFFDDIESSERAQLRILRHCRASP